MDKMKEDGSWSSVGDESLADTTKEDLVRRLDDLQKDKEAAVKLLQATLRTETFLDNMEGRSNRDIMDTIVTLVAGSHSPNIPELVEKAAKFAKEVMDRKSGFAVPVLAACDKIPDHISNNPYIADLEDLAMTKIRSNPQLLLDPEPLVGAEASAFGGLTRARIESIMADNKMEADEYTMFRILLKGGAPGIRWNRCIQARREVREARINRCNLAVF